MPLVIRAMAAAAMVSPSPRNPDARGRTEPPLAYKAHRKRPRFPLTPSDGFPPCAMRGALLSPDANYRQHGHSRLLAAVTHKQLLAPADEVVLLSRSHWYWLGPGFINNPAIEPGAGREMVVPPWQTDHHAASRLPGAPTRCRARHAAHGGSARHRTISTARPRRRQSRVRTRCKAA